MKIKYPSVIEEMTNAEYHSGAGDEAIGSSSLKTLATKTPAHQGHLFQCYRPLAYAFYPS